MNGALGPGKRRTAVTLLVVVALGATWLAIAEVERLRLATAD